ncbi:hypothetical protein IE81DRAFT_345839 [Ceraceosorus guamensis]|uniref:Uncharacterized protein n=1 Tax=Ceraceosorus guamensis TaxID=1522189 RepID=A0A316W3N2_9BASI|nr:hypothetical protein IE81DRAFT_345839 [Ceraceosorus guamensis]PWN44134.1 hypothetical protein IE81DRAFT_345839 [Ceraceosorus guamensis]
MKMLGISVERVKLAVLVAVQELNSGFGLPELYAFEAFCISVCGVYHLANMQKGHRAPKQNSKSSRLAEAPMGKQVSLIKFVGANNHTLQKEWRCLVFSPPLLRPRVVVLWEGAVGETIQTETEARLQCKLAACKVVVRSPYVIGAETLQEWLANPRTSIVAIGDGAYHMLSYRLECQHAKVIVHPHFDTLGRTFSCPNPSEPRLHPINVVPNVLSIKTGSSRTPLITTLRLVMAKHEHPSARACIVLTCIRAAALLSAMQGLEAQRQEQCQKLATSYLCGTGTHPAGDGVIKVSVEEAEGLGRCAMFYGRCRNPCPLPLDVEGEDAKLDSVFLMLKVWKDGTFCDPSGMFALSSIAEQAFNVDPMDIDLLSTSN